MILTQVFEIPFTLPNANDLEGARGRVAVQHGRFRWNAYNETKRKIQADIVVHIRAARLRPYPGRVSLSFLWREPNRRRDPLDIRAGAKIIMDALSCKRGDDDPQPRAGIIHCDGWHCIGGADDDFELAPKRPGVRVTLYGEAPRAPVRR